MKNKKDNVKVSKCVYKRLSGNYTVRKRIDGAITVKTFTNKAKAIKYSKSL